MLDLAGQGAQALPIRATGGRRGRLFVGWPRDRNEVNVDNFARAETHRMMADLQRDAGGINRFQHNRAPASVRADRDRMNRDTLYSFAVVDVSAGRR